MGQKTKTGQKVSENPVHIKDLVPDPKNRRAHNPRNIGMVVDALHQVGAARSIVIDEDNVILAGNGVTEAAAEAGITKVRVVEADGNEIIAVRRKGLSAEQKRHLAIADNRSAELAQWNAAQFREDLAGGQDFGKFFSKDELQKILGADPAKEGRTDPDDVPTVRPTSIQRGDLFELGAHRLLCGDATSQADVWRLLGEVVPFLMVTDPPYGVDYQPEWRNEALGEANRAVGHVANDSTVDWSSAWALFPGDVAYVWHAGRFASEVATSLLIASLEVRSQIIWAKQHFAISRGHYHWQHEPCWYVVRIDKTAKWQGDRSQSTLWEINNGLSQGGGHGPGDEVSGHGTQKPVECMLRPMRNHEAPVVYDPFVGSGTSLIAAEQLERSCFSLEINPQYCQVTIDRWEQFTGSKAVKVGEAVCV